MKSYFKRFFLYLFILPSVFIVASSPVQALKFGPHMVCNTNPESFADVRSEYNQMNNWTGIANKIPATIILQTSQKTDELVTIFTSARDQGIIPYVRLVGKDFWGQISTTETETFAQNLNSALASTGLTGIYVAPGNEPNRSDEWTSNNKIDSLADVLTVLLTNAQNYKVAFPGLDLYWDSGNWRSFLTEFNNQHHSLITSLANQGGFIGHSYTNSGDRNPGKWQEEKSYLDSVGASSQYFLYEANLNPSLNADAETQANYIKEIFSNYNSNQSIKVVTPFSRAHPASNVASADNPYLMLVIKEDGTDAKFIAYPHPGNGCGAGPNIMLTSQTIGGEKIVHKKSWLINALEVLHLIPASGTTNFSDKATTTNLPNLQPVSNVVDDSKNARLLPSVLQEKLSRNSNGEIPAQISFPNCNAAAKRTNDGFSTSSIIDERTVSNSLVLNDLLNSTSKNNNLQRKADDPLNYVVDTQKPASDTDLYNCGQVTQGETVNSQTASLDNQVTKWSGEFNEGNGVLAAETGPASSLTPTPAQRQATLEIVNQARTRTYLTEIADALSGTFGFITALIPSGLNKSAGLAGNVKNSVTTESDSKTQKDLDIAVPRAGEMVKTADTFKKMLLPQALQ